MFFVLVFAVHAGGQSSNRTHYYYNGSDYIVDTLLGEAVALDNSAVSPNDLPIEHGWRTPHACPHDGANGRCEYVIDMFGDTAINISSVASNTNSIRFYHYNDTFNGRVGVMFYDSGFTTADHFAIQFPHFNWRIGIDNSAPNNDEYVWDYNQNCDANTIKRSKYSYVNFTLDYYRPEEYLLFYINDTLCHNYTSFPYGIQTMIGSTIQGSSGTYFLIKNFYISNNKSTPQAPEPSDVTPPHITLLEPAEDEIVRHDVFINFTSNESSTCALNNTYWSEHFSNTTYFSYLESLAPDNTFYSVMIECNDSSLNTAYYVANFTKATPNVSIIFPPHNTTENGTSVNITFQFENFNSTACYLYSDYDRGYYNFIMIDNVTTINQTLNQSTNYTLSLTGLSEEEQAHMNFYVNCTEDNNYYTSQTIHVHHYDTVPPIITVLFPNTTYNDTYNQHMTLNFTTNENTTCTVNNTNFTQSYSNNTYHVFSESTLDNAFYSISITCDDGFNLGSTVIYFTKDLQYPFIKSFSPSEDNSSLFENTGTVLIHFNASDNNDLYSINVSIIDNSTGSEVYNDYVLTSGLYHVYEEEINTQNFTNQTKYIESVIVCDSHTKKEIKDAKAIVNDINYITYDFDGLLITIESFGGHEKSTHTYKDIDRYKFEFEYKDNSSHIKKYKLKSNGMIDYLEYSQNKGHFIINNKYWVDFEQEGDVIVDYECEFEEDLNQMVCYHVITVKNAKNRIKFDSVGELNCYQEDYVFELIPVQLTGYSLQHLAPTNWFNLDILDASTVAGVLMYLFLFIIIIACAVFGEYTRIPIIMILGGILGFFYGILLFVSVSAIIGVVFVALSIIYIIRANL